MLFKDRIPPKVYWVLFFGILIRLVLAWLPEKYLFYVIYDDAYYYFTIARNLATRGMLSADGITLTNGFHPLWLIVLAPVYLLFSNNLWLSAHLSLTLCAIFDTAAALVIYKMLEKLNKPKIGLVSAVFYLVHPYVLQYSMSGLETALNSFLLALLMYFSLSATRERLKTGWLGLGAVCGLVLLARTDNLFVVATLLVYLFWRDRRIFPVAKVACVAALVVVPWLGYNLAVFGTIVQTSGKTFPWLAYQQYLNEYGSYFTWRIVPYALKSGFYSFTLYAFHYGNWILTLLVGLLLLLRFKNVRDGGRPLLWTLVGAVLFLCVHVFVRWSLRPWYAQSVFVLTLPVVALAVARLHRYLVGVGISLVLYFAGITVCSPSFFHRIDRLRVMGEVIDRDLPPGDRVGAFNSGYLQYVTDKRVINLDGFVNNEVLSYYQKDKGLEYFQKMGIQWLVDYTVFIGGIFGRYFGPESEKSLYVLGQIADSVAAKNDILVVEVLPENLSAPPERRLKIFRGRAGPRRWGPLTWPRLKWE